jgi:hypothetical protein
MYAARHNYTLYKFGNIAHPRPPHFSKLLGALATLAKHDWLWVVDLDTLIMTPATSLLGFLDSRFDFIMAIGE